jgi:NRAMP (natural resistance-associated macrophage protein)-like metal ion transporter
MDKLKAANAEPLREQVHRTPGRVRRFFADLGPGLITGAADDDPSGISTYSVTGAAFGYSQLWTALFSFPLMAAVQLMCARLGMVSGMGLAGVIRRRYSRTVLWGACSILVVANVVNIGADLGGMAESMEMITHIRSFIWLPVFAALILAVLIWAGYKYIAGFSSGLRLSCWLMFLLRSLPIRAGMKF